MPNAVEAELQRSAVALRQLDAAAAEIQNAAAAYMQMKETDPASVIELQNAAAGDIQGAAAAYLAKLRAEKKTDTTLSTGIVAGFTAGIFSNRE